jgi:hypothetical protein
MNRSGTKQRKPYVRNYSSTSRINRLALQHPGIQDFIEGLLRRRLPRHEIAREIHKQFGVKISRSTVARYWEARVRPQEDAEAEAYRHARAQAKALLEEMKADPSLDAAQIAELMLANQIVKDRTKLAETDIMALYKEQRERRKLELQHKALQLREKQTKAVIEKINNSRRSKMAEPEVVEKIREIYGLAEPAPTA